MITGVRAPEHPDVPGSGETVTTVQDLVTFARNRPCDADRATVAILPHLPPRERPAVAWTTLLAASTIDPIESRIDSLLRLASALPAAHRAPALSRAFAAATATPDGPAQAQSLTKLASLLVADDPAAGRPDPG
jgi:hypothetical protein